MAFRASTCTRRPASALLVCALVLAFASPPAARASDDSAGTRAASFLSTGVGPAVLAMGGASLALGRDAQGAAWNTAALGWASGPQFALAHASFADQTSQEWGALAGRFGASPWRWGAAALYRDEGTIEGRDAANQPTSAMSSYDFALSLQLARPFGEHLSAGGATHFVRQQVADASGVGLAFDAGVQLRLGMLSLGLAGQDFGGGMLWDGVRWAMPATLGAGVAFEHAASGLRFALDYRRPADQTADMRMGGEWRIADRVALRGGYRAELGAGPDDHRSGPTFGLGTSVGALWFDYGYLVGGDGAGTHRVGLSMARMHRAGGAHAAPASAGPQPERTPGPPAPGN